MKRIKVIVVGIILCTIVNFNLSAQEQSIKVGFFAGMDKFSSYTGTRVYPTLNESSFIAESFYRIGAMIELPYLLIKPDAIVKFVSGDWDDRLSSISHTDFEYSLYGGGVSLYYPLHRNRRTNFYAGPRAEFSIAHKDKFHSDGEPEETEDSTAWSIMVCCAGQHFFNQHFSIFAEIGAGYGTVIKETVGWDSSTGNLDEDEVHRYPGIFTYGGQVGVVFYF